MDFSASLPTFVITLREGVEAALVVGIVLACLRKAQKTALNSWAYGGIVAGVMGSAVLGWLLNIALQQVHQLTPNLEAVVEPLLKVGLCTLAIAMLSWMLIWMTRQAKSLKGEIEGVVASRLEANGGWGVFLLVFIAVLREGFETVVFILANWQQGIEAVLGAVLGLFGAVGIGFMLFGLGIRINISRFFQVMGVLLLLIVTGLTMSLLKYADGAAIALGQLYHTNFCMTQDSCVLGSLLWDFSAWLPQRTFPGLLLKVMLGYRDHLYVLQAIVYITFLGSVGSLYFRSLNAKSSISS